MLIFFDTEFTDLKKDADLISIGLVSDTGKMFYAEFTDYSRDKCSDWVKKNVLNLLGNPKLMGNPLTQAFDTVYLAGDRKEISEQLIEWLKSFCDVELQFVSDCMHYDFVFLLDLLAQGNDLADIDLNLSFVCDDLNFYLSDVYRLSPSEAFDLSREELFHRLYFVKELPDEFKHNSLYDAYIIWKLYVKILPIYSGD
jgi:hypothetical protein